jgi:ankyrin repeat protein
MSNTSNQVYFDLPSTSRRSADNRSLKSPLDEQDGQGRTRLHHAVIDGTVDDVRTILSSGASIDIRDNFNDQPLHLALGRTSYQGQIAKLLLDFGASPDTRGKNGKTPLQLSLASRDTLEILLKAHPDLSASDLLGNTVLHDAALNIDKTLASFIKLLTYGADVNAVNAAGESPFHMILQRADGIVPGGTGILSSLQHGANVHMRNRRNRLPLEILADTLPSKLVGSRYMKTWFEEIEAFTTRGASLDIKLASGASVFSLLVEKGVFSADRDPNLGMLFCQRVDPHARGLNGNTALHELMGKSSTFTDTKLLEALLNRGSDPNAENNAGFTPFSLLFQRRKIWGKENISSKVVELLTQAGANSLHKGVSGDLLIYDAVRCQCRRSLAASMKALLSGSIMRLEKVGCPEATTRDKEWWQNYATSLRQAKNGDWPGADARLNGDESFLPEDVSEPIRTAARVVLAENTLMYHKAALSGKRDDEALSNVELGLICRNVIDVLRGCRNNRIQIDQTLYQLLLDVVD